MDRRHAVVAITAGVAALSLQPACGSGSASTTIPPVCAALHVAKQRVTLAEDDLQTSGFALTSGTQPVGIVLDRDGASVWVLGTGSDQVVHVMPDGSATTYQLPASNLGIQLTQAPDGTVWVPEKDRNAVAAISPDGSARECRLPRKNSETAATSAATDGSVWVTEDYGAAVAHLVGGRFVEYPIGVGGAEVLSAPDGGAWFTVHGAPVLGRIRPSGVVERIPIGGSGTTLGLMRAADGSIWVADFGGDRVVRVAPDNTLTEWHTTSGAKPQSLGIGPGGSIWFTESGKNKIATIRGSQVVDVYQTGDWPDHLAITADGWAWFTEYFQDRLGRVRLPAG